MHLLKLSLSLFCLCCCLCSCGKCVFVVGCVVVFVSALARVFGVSVLWL